MGGSTHRSSPLSSACPPTVPNPIPLSVPHQASNESAHLAAVGLVVGTLPPLLSACPQTVPNPIPLSVPHQASNESARLAAVALVVSNAAEVLPALWSASAAEPPLAEARALPYYLRTMLKLTCE
ncbi:hypothetical protein T492DRAFT_113707 [Pavlovales sp. CCMP2436]|nr:hypothetical protein T492DRAFT_113707 [Pavlovales sp. CCMP2436]